jgi:hypothetical protein
MSLIERLVVCARDVIGGLVATWEHGGIKDSVRAGPSSTHLVLRMWNMGISCKAVNDLRVFL